MQRHSLKAISLHMTVLLLRNMSKTFAVAAAARLGPQHPAHMLEGLEIPFHIPVISTVNQIIIIITINNGDYMINAGIR